MLANSEIWVKVEVSEEKLFFFFSVFVSQESLMFTFKFTHGGIVFVLGKMCQVPTLRPFEFTSLHSSWTFPCPVRSWGGP